MRVTGGIWRSRKLVAPTGSQTRPTSDRTREALFDVLAALELRGRILLQGARVLDLYAGTGAFGIEALSRGAAHATFVENARPALAALRENLSALAPRDTTRILTHPVERAVGNLLGEGGAFELIFCDPPYAYITGGQLAVTLGAIPTLLAPRGVLVLEHATRDSAPNAEALTVFHCREYGDTTLTFYSPGSSPDSD